MVACGASGMDDDEDGTPVFWGNGAWFRGSDGDVAYRTGSGFYECKSSFLQDILLLLNERIFELSWALDVSVLLSVYQFVLQITNVFLGDPLLEGHSDRRQWPNVTFGQALVQWLQYAWLAAQAELSSINDTFFERNNKRKIDKYVHVEIQA